MVNDQLTTVADQLKAQADQADRAELRAERDRYRDLYESERRHVETLMGTSQICAGTDAGNVQRSC